MADIDWSKYPALQHARGHGCVDTYSAKDVRKYLSQLIADVRREAKAEESFMCEGACAEQLLPENGDNRRAAYNQGVGECIRAIARIRGAVPEAVLMSEGEEKTDD